MLIKLTINKKDGRSPLRDVPTHTKRAVKIILKCSENAIDNNQIPASTKYAVGKHPRIYKIITKYSTNIVINTFNDSGISDGLGYASKRHAPGEPIKLILKFPSKATNSKNGGKSASPPMNSHATFQTHGDSIELINDIRNISNISNKLSPPTAFHHKLHSPGEPIKLVIRCPSNAINKGISPPPSFHHKLHAPGEPIKLIIKDPNYRRPTAAPYTKPHTRANVIQLSQQGGQWILPAFSDPEKLFREPRARKPELPRPYRAMEDEDLDDIPELNLGEPEVKVEKKFISSPSKSQKRKCLGVFKSANVLCYRSYREGQYDLVM